MEMTAEAIGGQRSVPGKHGALRTSSRTFWSPDCIWRADRGNGLSQGEENPHVACFLHVWRATFKLHSSLGRSSYSLIKEKVAVRKSLF
uniref:Uncharacterized protein n=1 Tax=Steinernema glaseri TaxID=37863 RepID=A0A1I7ZTJ8_9BILA